ncbi:MAG: hypothetical protein P1T08_18925 [Acidimicrobiia bacterium]|nr:hypothetical protein [Acidimicrobiia bacterium]
MHRRLAVLSVLAMLATVLPALPAFADAPDNDNFAEATEVYSYPYTDTVDITEATVETGEPLWCSAMANTVWYSLTLDESSLVMIDTAGSEFDTVLAVWQGTDLSNLSLVKCVDDTLLGGCRKSGFR